MFKQLSSFLLLGFVFLGTVLTQSCGTEPRKETLELKLEREMPQLMKAANVPGLSMAVVRDGRVFWHKAFGVKSTKTNDPVDEKTMFEAASLTKTVTAYAALRLVERGELELDRPLHLYFPNQEYQKLSGDARYKQLTARLVLTHTTGLPNWGSKFMRDPGLQYAYSGEGFLYLGRTIEQISGMSLQDFAQKEIFKPLGMAHTSFVWNETYAGNGACGHDRKGTAEELRKNTEPNAGASLLTTASDYAAFICAILNHQGLSKETIDGMTSRQVQVTKSRDTAELFENVFWGWGWGVQPGDSGDGFWHWGDNGTLRAFTLTYKDRREGFVYFANSNNGLAIAEALTALVFPDRQYALDWLDYEKYDDPRRLAGIAIEKAFLEQGAEAGLKEFQKAKEALPELMNADSLTSLARSLGESGQQEGAIEILKVCLDSFPESADAYLGLGMTYLETGQYEESVESFESALKINEADALTTRGLEWARESLKTQKEPPTLSLAELEKLAGDYGPRHITLRDGRLYYQRDDRPEYALIPLSKNTFALERLALLRIQFVEDQSGEITQLVGHYIYGNIDESLRNASE